MTIQNKDKIRCIWCGENFDGNSALMAHLEVCKYANVIRQDEGPLDENAGLVYDKIPDLDINIDNLIKERKELYGDPTPTHATVYHIWKKMMKLDDDIGSEIHAASMVELMMDVYKSIRAIGNPKHKDHYTDKRGYTRLVEKREVAE